MSFVHGPIRSTHLTLSTVKPNVNTVESWKAQGFRIETRVTQWMCREWSQDLYLNQQKYKAIFTPKYCRIASENERTSSWNCEVFSLFYQSVEAWRGSSAISKFLSADSVVLCCAMESLVESVLSPCNAELQSIIESECSNEQSRLSNYWETDPLWIWFHWASPAWAYGLSREDGKQSIVVLECWRTVLQLLLLDANNSRAGVTRGDRSSALTFV